MPYKAGHPCSHSGCPKIIPHGQKYCEEHKKLHPEYTRSASGRGYSSRWRRESKIFLRANPLCAECLKNGKYTQATVVDHIIPHRGDQTLFWDRQNWQPLCAECHTRKTWKEDANPVYHY